MIACTTAAVLAEERRHIYGDSRVVLSQGRHDGCNGSSTAS
jgi:hypothetical protein